MTTPDPAPAAAPVADADGNLVVPGTFGGSYTLDATTGALRPRTASDVYNYAPKNFMQRPDKRWAGGAFINYDMNKYMTLYGEVMFMDDTTDAQIAESGDFGNSSLVNCNNPLLSAAEVAAFCTNAGYDYTRSGNPTRAALEEALALLEGGAGATCTSTGMSAVVVALNLLPKGSHLLSTVDCYGGTFRALEHAKATYGLRRVIQRLASNAFRGRDNDTPESARAQKMLTRQLRALEQDRLVSRTEYPGMPPRVEYALTARGQSVIPLLSSLKDWAGAELAET